MLNDKSCSPDLIFWLIWLILTSKNDFENEKLAFFVSWFQSFSKRYKIIFDLWPKFCIGFDVQLEIQTLKESKYSKLPFLKGIY